MSQRIDFFFNPDVPVAKGRRQGGGSVMILVGIFDHYWTIQRS